jgi:maltose O-acetyltransferase
MKAQVAGRALPARILGAIKEEVEQLRPRFHGLAFASRVLPSPAGNRLRAAMLRGMGFAIGEGTVVLGGPNFTGGNLSLSTLSVGKDCVIGVGCSFDLAERITLGDRVNLGHQVMILTSSHELGPRDHRAGAIYRNPVTIESGAWVGARSIVLPGVTIGLGAVVAPGSLVNKDVAAHTRVAGIPAKFGEALEP